MTGQEALEFIRKVRALEARMKALPPREAEALKPLVGPMASVLDAAAILELLLDSDPSIDLAATLNMPSFNHQVWGALAGAVQVLSGTVSRHEQRAGRGHLN